VITNKFSLILFVLLFSCQENKEKSIKDFGQVVPKSNRTEKKQLADSNEVDSSRLKFYSKLENLTIDSVNELTKTLFPDRFGPIKKTKETLYFKKDSLQFLEYTYKDTIISKRALYNLMDCFEIPCKSFKFHESTNVSKSSFSIFYSQKSLIILKSSADIKVNDWLSFLEKEKGYKSFEIVISQSKNGKTKWFSSKNAKLIPIPKK
jgi:hypothetical protein